jgi:hypothetical protein
MLENMADSDSKGGYIGDPPEMLLPVVTKLPVELTLFDGRGLKYWIIHPTSRPFSRSGGIKDEI